MYVKIKLQLIELFANEVDQHLFLKVLFLYWANKVVFTTFEKGKY